MYLNLPMNFFEHKRFTKEKIWSPDLYLIKNLQSIVKMKLYEGGKQYNSKTDLWETIKITMSEIEPAEVKKITKSMAVIEKACYIKM